MNNKNIIKLKELKKLLGYVSKDLIVEWEKNHDFPVSITLDGEELWERDEVYEWIIEKGLLRWIINLHVLKDGYCPWNITHKKANSLTLTEKEAATYIGMSRSFLRQSRMNGGRINRTNAPKFIKIGASVRYLKSELDEWIKTQPLKTNNLT